MEVASLRARWYILAGLLLLVFLIPYMISGIMPPFAPEYEGTVYNYVSDVLRFWADNGILVREQWSEFWQQWIVIP